MIHFLASICASTMIVLVFKLFPRFQVRRFQAIVVNYWMAFALGLLLSQDGNWSELTEMSWFFLVPIEGFLFISIFNVMALTVQHHGLSIGSIASRTAFIIPAALFMVLQPEIGFSILKVIAVLTAFVAVALCVGKTNGEIDKRYIYLPILLFIGSGLVDFVIGYAQTFLLSGPEESRMFIPSIFFTAAIIGTTLALFRYFKHPDQGIRWTEFIAGMILGLINYASLYFILRAMDTKLLPPSIFFPVYNLGIVIAGVLLGAFVFAEDLSTRKRYGIALGLMAVALMIFAP